LDGLTILRFAHAFKNGGGIETYLNDLDRILLSRNSVKIIRFYLENESKNRKITTKKIGLGLLIEVPMQIESFSNSDLPIKSKTRLIECSFLRKLFREVIIYNPILYKFFLQKFLKRYYPRPGIIQSGNLSENLCVIHQKYKIDLIVMHYIGDKDTAEMIEEARKQGTPFVYINHFSNDSYSDISVREQLHDAAGIAGVTDFKVPRSLAKQFFNVSDGINLKIFKTSQAQSPAMQLSGPIIFYPARITKAKGQKDLLTAYSILKNKGIKANIVFAGRTDSLEYKSELEFLAKEMGIMDDIHFLGELSKAELRDWYSISTLLAFPTYHPEGLPRILMESQAMGVPPVVYESGGTPSALRDCETGFLVPKGDVNKLSQRLQELIVRPDKRNQMGENGIKFAQNNFSLEALAERHEWFYLEALTKE
jgi:glycosyltransferase involved in cell wall biosynthesis